MNETLRAELPLRVALAVGRCVMDKAEWTYLGQPLVEAARSEKAQKWVGLAFGPSFESRQDVRFSADLFRPYTGHQKPGYSDAVLGLVVDWPRAWCEEHQESAHPP